MNCHGLNAAGLNRGEELLTVIPAGASISAGMTAVADPQRRKRASAAFIGRATATPVVAANVVVGGTVPVLGRATLVSAPTLNATVAFVGRAQYGLRRTSILYHASASMSGGFKFLTPTEIVNAASAMVALGEFTVSDEAFRALYVNFHCGCVASGASFSVRGGSASLTGASELVVEPGVNGVYFFIGRLRGAGSVGSSPAISRGGAADGRVQSTMSDVPSYRIQRKRASNVSGGTLVVDTPQRVRKAAAAATAFGTVAAVATRVCQSEAEGYGSWACGIVNHKWRVTRFAFASGQLSSGIGVTGNRRHRPCVSFSSPAILDPVFSVRRGASAQAIGQAGVSADGVRERQSVESFACAAAMGAQATMDAWGHAEFFTETAISAGTTIWPTKDMTADGLFDAENTLIKYAQQGAGGFFGDSSLEVSNAGVEFFTAASADILAGLSADIDDSHIRLAIQASADILAGGWLNVSAGVFFTVTENVFYTRGRFRGAVFFPSAPESRTANVPPYEQTMIVPIEIREMRVL